MAKDNMNLKMLKKLRWGATGCTLDLPDIAVSSESVQKEKETAVCGIFNRNSKFVKYALLASMFVASKMVVSNQVASAVRMFMTIRTLVTSQALGSVTTGVSWSDGRILKLVPSTPVKSAARLKIVNSTGKNVIVRTDGSTERNLMKLNKDLLKLESDYERLINRVSDILLRTQKGTTLSYGYKFIKNP